MNRRWLLMLDETGGFADLGDTVLVGGLLVPAGYADRLRELRGRLAQSLPWIPWPPHANRFNRAVFPAVVAAAWPDRPGTPHFAHEAARILAADFPEILGPVVKAFRDGSRLPFDNFKKLDQHLVRYAEVFARLTALRNQTVATLSNELKRLRRAPSLEDIPTIVLAGETEAGDAVSPVRRWGKLEDDRFLGELGCLFRRVTDILSTLGGQHHVDLLICSRGITLLGGRHQIRLHWKMVRQTVDENTGKAPDVAWGNISVHDYDDEIPAELVFADYVTNVSRRYLQKSIRLSKAEPLLQTQLRTATRFVDSRGSHIAATGIAQQWLENAFGRAATPLTSLDAQAGRKRWACDQAREWFERVSGGAVS